MSDDNDDVSAAGSPLSPAREEEEQQEELVDLDQEPRPNDDDDDDDVVDPSAMRMNDAVAAANDNDNHHDDDDFNSTIINVNDDNVADAAADTSPPSTPLSTSRRNSTNMNNNSSSSSDSEDDFEDNADAGVGGEGAAASPTNRNIEANNSNHEEQEQAIPATPLNATGQRGGTGGGDNYLGATPGTPLTPLSDLGVGGSGSSGGRRSRTRRRGEDDEDDEDDDNRRGGGRGGDGGAANLRFEQMRGGTNNEEDDDDDDEEDDEDLAEDAIESSRTNIDVVLSAQTFRHFLRTFTTLKATKRANRRGGGGDDDDADDDDDDDESDSDSDSDDEDLNNNNNGVPPPPLYISKLQSMLHRTTQGSLDIDMEHLFYYNEACQVLCNHLVDFPMEVIPLMDIVVQREMKRLLDAEETMDEHNNEEDDDASQYPLPMVQVRPFNKRKVSNLRELDPVSIDTLVAIRGMIVRNSPIIPDLKVAHFTCCICGDDQQVRIDRGRIQEPRQCPSCNTKDSYQLQHNRCIFADKQLVRLQETPDQVPAGQTPASVVTFCFDDLVDACQPGDKVEVTGILRAQPVRIHPRVTKLKSMYKTYVDVIHFRAVTGMEQETKASRNSSKSSSKKAGKGIVKMTQERIEMLKQLSQQPDIYDQLTRSLAPSIWELDNVKRGVLCMLFGGNHKRVSNNKDPDGAEKDDEQMQGATATADGWSDDEDEGGGRTGNGDGEDTKLNKRGDINILLCGDPGTSKSQLLSYVHKLSSRGIYTSGKGSSAVGLTASVVRDPETKDLVLESGALVLSDRGICCIDEFDKMTDATRSILHEAMEQQTVSIAKAGIISSLNARTSILASANPVESRYNPNLSVVENIRLPPTLLSRFDLIYLILDSPNVDSDRQLAQHLVGLYYEKPNVVEPPLSTELLRDYIDYARENINPRLSDEATEELLKSYLELRNPPGGNVGNNGSRTISATPRQLESLIRTSEALAKMRYSSEVTRADAKEAVRLLKVATQAAATDPRTGRIDMDMINTGRTSVERELEESLYIGLKEYLSERRGNRLAVRDVARQLGEITGTPVPQDDVVVALRRLEADGVAQFNERNQTVFARTGIA